MERQKTICNVKSWVNDNIYNYRKADGLMYLFFYIIIPVTVTASSLYFLPLNNESAAYCYITILISALNCGYDAANRWQFKQESIVNTKLFCIGISLIIVAVYCFIEILIILIGKAINSRADWILCAYFLTVAIAMIDIVVCFAVDTVLGKYVRKQ